MKLRLLLVLILLYSTSCFAQLTMVNPTDQPVSVAVGFYVEKGLFKGWNTKGWLPIAPHDSITLLPTGIAGGSFYYHGVSALCDQGYAGNYALFVHPSEAFAIANAGTDAPVTLNKDVKKAGFVKVDLPAGQRSYRLRLPALNCTQQGRRTGEWTVYLDRDKEEVRKPEQATYVRRISYQQGVPTGLVRDYYYPSNVLQWDGKLLSEHPAVPQGTCITYDETGRKREELVYQNGRVTGSTRRWDAAGKEMVITRKYRTVKILEPQQGYLVSYYNPGKSRTVIPVTLPPNTVSWYYEFTAFRNEAQLQAARTQFKLMSELSRLVDQTGALKFALTALSTPPGGSICNVFLLGSPEQTDLFQAKQEFSYVREGTRSSLTSAVVPVSQPVSQQVYLGLHNPDNLYGIHYALEVVAIVEE
ncbi:DUF1036 domain-containing protein [Hymenobacter sediminis]|uniref:DUF1036 domain-containing protein n=1 Tax=Hymenobacter sediminis TaxID=2218621 RepID=UPI000DA6B96C|nr:DUF1036 domain-containing protein [Hymenobacter sediminis]RPD44138.1 DUF1036 domain-containing protein [Hymenobacter sediminis]